MVVAVPAAPPSRPAPCAARRGRRAGDWRHRRGAAAGIVTRDDPRRATRAEVPMSQHPRAGQPALPSELVDVPALLRAYDEIRPDPSDPAQRVAFGTSGHRGSAFRAAFNEAHILATTEAICRYRAAQGYTGPLFIGRDTHALSEPAWRTALEVLVANGVDVRVDSEDGFTPTPAISHAILVANRGRSGGARGRHRRHAVAQPARRRRLQVQPAQRRPGRHGRHAAGSRTRRTGSSRPPAPTGSTASAACPSSGRARRRGSTTSAARTSPTSRTSSTWRPSAGPGCASGVDPLGGAAVAYWGLDRRALRPGPHRHQRGRRPARSGS